ncbi:hypothetical protein KIH39_18415 [Telmatocola sphagniphila]|uniref:Uncharacterized protein n=1 Tax=Telmatocola sphagniphila TaxID=1123043 RepID=A0A8E6B3S9_9BACT|nr:hypothetical protein [Telmatocola sphagniphila]QVL30812.1 hypothetical protein KIH39_18415 [Telmatocola sphagniphila]
MRFPIVPLISTVCAALGLGGLYWYYQLSKEEQQEADRIAMGYARSLYNKTVEELTSSEIDKIRALTKSHFSA